jgi:hypothetical protein
LVRNNFVDHALKVRIGPCDDPAQNVATTRNRMRLKHFRNRRQVHRDDVVSFVLADFESHECRNREPDRRRIQVRPEPSDDAAYQKPVEPGLNSAPGYLQPPGKLKHTDPRFGGQQLDQLPIDGI